MRLIINDCGGAAFAVTVSMPNNAQLCNIVNGRIRQARICQNIGLGGGADLHDNLGAEGQLGFGNLQLWGREKLPMNIDNESRIHEKQEYK